MRYVKVFLELEKVIPLTIKDGDLQSQASMFVIEMIELDEKNSSFLSSFELYESEFEEVEAKEKTFTLVKKAIDSFDPYFVHPDSYDEYDGESRRIAKKIKKEMPVDDIAEIMKEEFNWSFSADFSKEDFDYSADKVHSLLEDSSDENSVNKLDIYSKLTLHKVIPVKVLENEDARSKVIEMVFDEINYDKENKSFLSTFNISVDYGTEEIDEDN